VAAQPLPITAVVVRDTNVERGAENNFELDVEPVAEIDSSTSAMVLRKPLNKSKEVDSDLLAQKFGVNAIGEYFCRDFGPDVFYGKITNQRRPVHSNLFGQ
jgi:hypothetical protein